MVTSRAVPRAMSLVVGVGARRGVPCEEVVSLIRVVLDEAGLPLEAVVQLATVAPKADEPGLVRAARHLGVPLRGYDAAALAAVPVPHPEAATRAATGTPSVAEAAALLAAGPRGELLVTKRKSAPGDGRPSATCAVARCDAPTAVHAMVTTTAGTTARDTDRTADRSADGVMAGGPVGTVPTRGYGVQHPPYDRARTDTHGERPGRYRPFETAREARADARTPPGGGSAVVSNVSEARSEADPPRTVTPAPTMAPAPPASARIAPARTRTEETP